MITRYFICEEHEEIGELGWKPEWLPGAEPFQGTTVAHDAMEHGLNDDGGAEHELMALGAVLLTRGCSGWFYQNNPFNSDVVLNLSSDLIDILMRVEWGDQTLRKPPRNTRRVREESIEEQIQRIARMGLKFHRESGGDRNALPHDAFERIVSWLRMGYRRADRRYRGIQEWRLANIFDRIVEEADKQLKWADGFGERLKVQFDPKRDFVKVTMLQPEPEF